MAISFQRRLRGKNATRERWTVTVRRDGVSVSATFPSRSVAEKWGHATETDIVRATELGFPFDRDRARRRGRKATLPELHRELAELDYAREPDTDPRPRAEWTLGRALQHYLETVTPTKKGADREKSRIELWQRRPIASKRLCDITPGDLQNHIERRLAAGRAATTIRNEVFLLSGLYRLALKLAPEGATPRPTHGWGLTALKNPVPAVELPSPAPHRDRRLQDGDEELDIVGEEERLRSALSNGSDGPAMADLFTLAIETAMRLSELLSIRPSQMRREQGVRYILQPDSKNGSPRKVVLSSRAAAVVLGRIRSAGDGDGPLFPLSVSTVENRWRAARVEAKINGLTFHDLRHEGLSRMANRGLNIAELQQQAGQRTASVTMRYVNQKISEVASKLG